MQTTLTTETLSTGRQIIAGIHCFSSGYTLDGERIEGAAPMTEAETSEAWDIVNAKCRAHRAAKAAS